MKEIIFEKIAEIERKENVRVLHAVESGSRAWGFESPDSDYDVRFIYVRPKEFYLKLEETRDVIEWQLDDVFDINGWDLQKALRLLQRSNPTLFEWSNSPIVYKTTADWTDIKAKMDNYFVLKSGLYHYLSAANNNYCTYLKKDKVKLKKYFYALRPILACKWIFNKQSSPPILFNELVASELEPEMKGFIDELLYIKMNSLEVSEGDRIDELNQYIEHQLVELRVLADSLPKADQRNWEPLDELFLSVLG